MRHSAAEPRMRPEGAKVKEKSGKNGWRLMSALGFGRTFLSYRKGVEAIVKIKSAAYHLRLIRGVRGVYAAVFQFSFCIIFFFTGVLALHIAAFFIMKQGGMSPAAWTFLALGFLQCAPAVAFAVWFLSSKRWMKEFLRDHPHLKKAVLDGESGLTEDDLKL